MKSFIITAILMIIPALSFAGPRLVYWTMVVDSTKYETRCSEEGFYAADVDDAGNFVIAAPIPDYELSAEERYGVRIYRILSDGSDMEIIADIAGYTACKQLFCRSSGIYAVFSYHTRSHIIKVSYTGDIVSEFTTTEGLQNHKIFVDDQGYVYTALDVEQDLYILDVTTIPTTANALDNEYNGGSDILLQKYDPMGTLLFSTFLGGSGNDLSVNITVDNMGNWYVSCYELSPDFPYPIENESPYFHRYLLTMTPTYDEVHVYKTALHTRNYFTYENGALYGDALSKYTTTGQDIWWMYFVDEYPEYHNPGMSKLGDVHDLVNYRSMLVDQSSIFVIRHLEDDTPFAVTTDALFSEPHLDGTDLGVWKVDEEGNVLYGSYFGGSANEETTMNAMAYRNGILYVAGFSRSFDLPLTSGAYIDSRAEPLPIINPWPWGLFAFALDFNETTGVAEESAITPDTFILDPPHPNPFNPATTISFTLPEAEVVRLLIYDISGQNVRELAGVQLSAGRHEFVWDGRDDNGDMVSSGVYFCRLHAGENVAVRKVTLVR